MNAEFLPTVNIWSHIFGSILFFTLPLYVFREILPRYGSASTADIIVFSTFFFWSSGLLHAFSNVRRLAFSAYSTVNY